MIACTLSILERGGRGLGRFLEHVAELALQAVEHLHVARDDVACVQVVDVVLAERQLAREARLENTAERRVDAGDVLVPQRVADRVQRRRLARHERQREAQQLGTLVLVFLITHGC